MAWFKQLTFYQLLILITIGLMAAAIFFSASWAFSTGIPKHLEQIQEGYERINKQNLDELHRRDESHLEVIKNVSDRYDARVKSIIEQTSERDKSMERFADKLEKILTGQRETVRDIKEIKEGVVK